MARHRRGGFSRRHSFHHNCLADRHCSCCRRSEGVGVVEKSGPGADKFQPWQRVVAAGWAAGTWQDHIVQPEKSLVGSIDCIRATHRRAACCSYSMAAPDHCHWVTCHHCHRVTTRRSSSTHMSPTCRVAVHGAQTCSQAVADDEPCCRCNPITVLGLTEISAVPLGGWLLQTAAGSASRVQDWAEVLQLWLSATLQRRPSCTRKASQ